MMSIGDAHRAAGAARPVARPCVPQEIRLAHELARLVGAHGEQQRRVAARLHVHRRQLARADVVEPEVTVERKMHERREVVHAGQRYRAVHGMRGQTEIRRRSGVQHRGEVAARGMTGNDQGCRRNAEARRFANEECKRPAHLGADLTDGRLRTEIVVDHGHGHALREEGRHDEGVVGLVERAPPAAVDEHQRAARRAGRQVEVEGLLHPTAVSHVAARRERSNHVARRRRPPLEPYGMLGHRGPVVVSALDELRRVDRRLNRAHSSGGAMRTASGVRPSIVPCS
jgi:hypothetical protein